MFSSLPAGLLESLPHSAMLDPLLGLLTLFHVFAAVCFLTDADAVYKKALMKAYHDVVKFYHGIPLMRTAINLCLAITTAKMAHRAYHHPDDATTLFRAAICFQTLLCALVLEKVSKTLVQMGVDVTMKAEHHLEQHDIQTWTPPPTWVANVFAPLYWILRPEFHGTENIPTDQPGLYVMNHAYGFFEAIPLVASLFETKNVFLRALGDKLIFGPPLGGLCHYFGVVSGTRENADVLMEKRENVLVYPGGGYELMKRCAIPNYTLMWRKRLGFARIAIKHGYPIVPCCCVGTEDMQERVMDVNCNFVRKGLTAAIAVVWPHKIQRCYYWFGEPIPTTQYKGDYENDEFAKEVREKAKAAIEAGIREMQLRQANDPNRFMYQHVANTVLGSNKQAS